MQYLQGFLAKKAFENRELRNRGLEVRILSGVLGVSHTGYAAYDDVRGRFETANWPLSEINVQRLRAQDGLPSEPSLHFGCNHVLWIRRLAILFYHIPKPFCRKSRKTWYVKISSRQINLGPDKDPAFQRYYELMACPLRND